jgi:HK97 family phage prohead protease
MAKEKQTPLLERRAFALDALELESRGEGKPPRIRGHVAVFNERSVDLGGWVEVIAPGAFKESVDGDDIRALFNHNPDWVLGRNLSNTLELNEDSRGLLMTIEPPDTQAGRDVVTSIERGDVSGGSFGFRVRPNGANWAEDDDGTIVRTLTRVRLYDVSPVTFPAYPQTDVAVRELRDYRAVLEAARHREPRPRSTLSMRKRQLEVLSLDL